MKENDVDQYFVWSEVLVLNHNSMTIVIVVANVVGTR